MKRVIAFMVTPRGLTGGPRRLLTLASVAKEMNIEFVIASEAGSDLLKAANAAGIATVPMDTVGVLGLRGGKLLKGGLLFKAKVAVDILSSNLRVARMIRQQRAEAVWIRGSKGFAFAGFGAVISRRALIWDVDGEPRTRGVVGLLLSLALKLSDEIIVQYRSAVSRVFKVNSQGGRLRKISVLVPGVNLEVLTAHCKQANGVKGGGGGFRIIQVGSVCENKNQLFAVDVISRLSERKNIELCFVGGVLDESSQAQVKAKVAQCGLESSVVFCGWRDDIHALMAEADLLVMPSRDEGVPNTVQEAMAIGVPVIVSNAGGMPEIVSHGETGWVLPLDDPEAWAKQIEICRRDPALCRAVGDAARAYAIGHFGTESWGRKYAEVINSVVGNKRKHATS